MTQTKKSISTSNTNSIDLNSELSLHNNKRKNLDKMNLLFSTNNIETLKAALELKKTREYMSSSASLINNNPTLIAMGHNSYASYVVENNPCDEQEQLIKKLSRYSKEELNKRIDDIKAGVNSLQRYFAPEIKNILINLAKNGKTKTLWQKLNDFQDLQSDFNFIQDENSNNLLHYYSRQVTVRREKANEQMVEILLTRGINPFHPNKEGKTPFYLAIHNKNTKVLELYLNHLRIAVPEWIINHENFTFNEEIIKTDITDIADDNEREVAINEHREALDKKADIDSLLIFNETLQWLGERVKSDKEKLRTDLRNKIYEIFTNRVKNGEQELDTYASSLILDAIEQRDFDKFFKEINKVEKSGWKENLKNFFLRRRETFSLKVAKAKSKWKENRRVSELEHGRMLDKKKLSMKDEIIRRLMEENLRLKENNSQKPSTTTTSNPQSDFFANLSDDDFVTTGNETEEIEMLTEVNCSDAENNESAHETENANITNFSTQL